MRTINQWFMGVLDPQTPFEPFQCPQPTSTHPNISIEARLENIHNLEKPYQCSWEGCLFRAKTKGRLRLHLVRHENLKCNVTGCSFVASTTYRRMKHAMSHNISNTEHLFLCEFNGCAFSAQKASQLSSHVKYHHKTRPLIACTWIDCKYATPSKTDLAKHIRTHTKEQPYKCTWEGCTYTCATSSSLCTHVRSHKSKACHWPDCLFTASTVRHLKEHLKKHLYEFSQEIVESIL